MHSQKFVCGLAFPLWTHPWSTGLNQQETKFDGNEASMFVWEVRVHTHTPHSFSHAFSDRDADSHSHTHTQQNSQHTSSILYSFTSSSAVSAAWWLWLVTACDQHGWPCSGCRYARGNPVLFAGILYCREYIVSYIWMRYIIQMYAACHAYRWVLSHWLMGPG